MSGRNTYHSFLDTAPKMSLTTSSLLTLFVRLAEGGGFSGETLRLWGPPGRWSLETKIQQEACDGLRAEHSFPTYPNGTAAAAGTHLFPGLDELFARAVSLRRLKREC